MSSVAVPVLLEETVVIFMKLTKTNIKNDDLFIAMCDFLYIIYQDSSHSVDIIAAINCYNIIPWPASLVSLFLSENVSDPSDLEINHQTLKEL